MHTALTPLVSLLPVLVFLALLLWMDSYKLMQPRAVAAMLGWGAAMAAIGGLLAQAVIDDALLSRRQYSLYLAPVIEELLKMAVVTVLVRRHRVGFLVDAAIAGFAVGTGFALLENLYYVHRVATGAGLSTWIVRGFGTAIMHGGCTAIAAVLGMTLLERSGQRLWRAFAPGALLAIGLHAAYNHLSRDPRLTTLIVLVVLPIALYAVFRRSEASMQDWLAQGFDSDVDLMQLLQTGEPADSPAGRHLRTLRRRLQDALLADVLRYLHLSTELSMRAKGLLMMRANGFEPPADPQVHAGVKQLGELEQRIGKTGVRAVRPLLRGHQREVWQLGLLR